MAKLSAVVVLPLALSVAHADGIIQSSDADIKATLIGSWIIPPDSSDYGPENRYGVETYHSDGSDIFVVYSDGTCKKVVVRLTARWTVQNRILTAVLPDGKKLSDEILDVKANAMTLRSLDDGTTFTRERGTPCGAQVS